MKNLNNTKISVIKNEKVIRKGSQILISDSFNQEINKLTEENLIKFTNEFNISSIQYVSDKDFNKFVEIVEEEEKLKLEIKITEKIRKITKTNRAIQARLANDNVDIEFFIENAISYYSDKIKSIKEITIKSILTEIENGEIY